MTGKMSKVSFVFPVYNEEENLNYLYQQVKGACGEAGVEYEMIFVDDGSTDNSLDVVKKLRDKDGKIKYVSLSRNFGHQNAFFAGLNYATGDAVITMDADLQHPPSLIPKMIDMWRRGAEVVYTVKANVRLDNVKSVIVKCAYVFIAKISGLNLRFGQSDFRLIDKKVLKVMLNMPEYHKFLRGQISWVGFKQQGLSYDVEKRYAGLPKYTYKSLYMLALDGIFSFGKYPLHMVIASSLMVLSASLIYIFIVLLIWVLKMMMIIHLPMPPGWTTLAIGVLLLGSIQLLSLGILSEYVGRIYDETKGRPVFIVREESS